MKIFTTILGICLADVALILVAGNAKVKEILMQDAERLTREGFLQDEKPDSVLGQPQLCTNNRVEIDGEVFDCDNVDFLSYLSLKDLEITNGGHPEGFRAADIWGWLTPSGREFTLISLDNGVAVVDTTDPIEPCVIAKMPTGRTIHIWADVKVYDNTMYVSKDMRGPDSSETENYGVEVFDLLPLDQLNCKAPDYNPPKLYPNYVYDGHGQCHNLVVNTESGLVYSVGTEVCAGGFMMLDVKADRLKPELLMCADADGYTHDGQCLIYDGPDVEHQGKEICFGFNEDSLTIWDFSDISNPTILSRTQYPNQAYTHQGWVNNDLTKVMLDDELDEMCNSDDPHPYCEDFAQDLNGLLKTSTDVFDITDLDNPVFEGAYIHKDISVDHNLYVWGLIHRKGWGGNPPMEFYPDPNFLYLNNYLAGVRILDIHSSNIEDWFEAGYFDIAPDRTELAFAGAWSGYLHPSGVYAVSSIERGLFLLRPRMAYTDDFPQGPDANPPPAPAPTPAPNPSSDLIMVLIILLVLLGMIICMGVKIFKTGANAADVEVSEKKSRNGQAVVGEVQAQKILF